MAHPGFAVGGADSNSRCASEASVQNFRPRPLITRSSKFADTCRNGAAKLKSLKIVEYSELSVSLALFSWLFLVKTSDLSSKRGAEAVLS